MGIGGILGISFAVFFVVLALVFLVLWMTCTNQNYGRRIMPGDTYTVNGKEYAVPELPLKGKAYLLKEEYMVRQRELLKNVTAFFDMKGIEYWLSGGTLLGFVRHETTIPWDDDLDVHTHWKHREYMFSKKFARDLNEHGLQSMLLLGASLKSVDKHGGAVRIRDAKGDVPVCDVFFAKQDEQTVAKVDSWNGKKLNFNKKERWPVDVVFPTEEREVDGFKLRFPNKPEAFLKQQYGPSVLTNMVSQNKYYSHFFPFQALHWIWQKP